MPSEGEGAGFAVNSEGRDVVATLIARIKKVPGRIKIETAGIVAAGPFLPDKGQGAGIANGKERDAIVQAVGCVEELAIGRHHDFGRKTASGKAWRQAGDGLSLRQMAFVCVVIEKHNGGAFFLQRIKPAPVGMEGKVPRPVSWRQCDGGGIVGGKDAGVGVEFPHEDLVQPQVGGDRKAPRGIRGDHVGVSYIVTANGKASRRGVGRLFRSYRSNILFQVTRGPELAVGQDGNHGHGSPKIICD